MRLQRFEKNAADHVAPDMLIGEDIDVVDTTLLFAGENVDHNILDGKGTFHGMGMRAALTQDTIQNLPFPGGISAELNIAEKTKVEFTLPIM